MNVIRRRTLRKILQRMPASFAVVALAMQVALPVLHAPHAPAGFGSDVTPTFEAAATHHDGEARHDATSCSQCRLVSQLGSAAPQSVASAAPALHEGWLSHGAGFVIRSVVERESGPPRAPPFLA